ncbi:MULTISPECIES: RNA polymerase sigma factor [unclassified Paenibacillus]|uniref:RNA polymerase sigma factor n=1 Tax=unclassified Paenibacillus TaxID=185978 RepID=UPI001C109C1F|nr:MULTISPECIES: sigma-70 family RNA polymerase sigma factor [unclassified Paenibacillus]MBU5441410.1 sigma-70 family RNA polymerase sigma factor [Paenibacillus sp. MSJ-34]CAH0118276.1 ECF RNA polymerase sigma factor RpoE [Paenibacillus sp. CECT 9249]
MIAKDTTSSLLQEMHNGSMEAFEVFYERYAPLIFHIALKLTKDRMEAEDICHDVFLEVFRKADRFDPSRGSLEAWLSVMTRSRSLDRLRRKQRLVYNEPQEEYAAPADANPEQRAMLELDKERLYAAIDNIPQPQKEALIGFYCEARTQKQLAQKLNYPLGTVKSLIRYGIRNIRKQWNDRKQLSKSEEARQHE